MSHVPWFCTLSFLENFVGFSTLLGGSFIYQPWDAQTFHFGDTPPKFFHVAPETRPGPSFRKGSSSFWHHFPSRLNFGGVHNFGGVQHSQYTPRLGGQVYRRLISWEIHTATWGLVIFPSVGLLLTQLFATLGPHMALNKVITKRKVDHVDSSNCTQLKGFSHSLNLRV